MCWKLARAGRPSLRTRKFNNSWSTDDGQTSRHPDVRILAAVFLTQQLWFTVIKAASLSFVAAPFSKGTTAASLSLKVMIEFACCLCFGVLHSSQSPLFSLAAVCGFCFDFFSWTYGRHTDQYLSPSNDARRTTDDGRHTDHPNFESEHLDLTLKRGFIRECDLICGSPTCTEEACRGVAIHRSIASPFVLLKASERPIVGRFGGNL
jgi:hypothetical protein